MWVTRNKKDTYESDSLVLWLDDEKPTRIDNGDGNYQYWFGCCGIELKPYTEVWYDRCKYLKWEDDPIEVGLYDDTLFKFISELITEYNDNVHLKYDYIKERFLNYISNEQSKSE